MASTTFPSCQPWKYPLPNHTKVPCCPYVPCVQATPIGAPRGFDPVTIRRPTIVYDSTFEYRPTARAGKLLDVRDKHIRYMLINQQTAFSTPVRRPCGRSYCVPQKYVAWNQFQ